MEGLYSIKDTVAVKFSRPFCQVNDAAAQREFRRALSRELDEARDDFELYKLGVFHDDDGFVGLVDEPELMLRGSDTRPIKDEVPF